MSSLGIWDACPVRAPNNVCRDPVVVALSRMSPGVVPARKPSTAYESPVAI
jgi:hypothetical protein